MSYRPDHRNPPARTIAAAANKPSGSSIFREMSGIIVSGSEPEAHARHEAGVARLKGVVAAKVGRSAEGAIPTDADIGCELAVDLVAQSQADIERTETGADLAARIVLAVQVCFSVPLQDEPVRKERLVARLEPRRRLARTADVGGGFKFDLVWS